MPSDDEVARYILAADQNALPTDFKRWAKQFAITNLRQRESTIAA